MYLKYVQVLSPVVYTWKVYQPLAFLQVLTALVLMPSVGK